MIQTNGKHAQQGDIPIELARPEFLELWELWLQYRREELRRPVTPISAKMSLKALSKMGLERAIAAIEHTIANGWQGIREPDLPRGMHEAPRVADPRSMRDLGL